MALELPPRVRQELEKEKWADQRREIQALIPQLLDFDDPICQEWNPILEGVFGPGMVRVGRARPKAWNALLPVRAGFYHWVAQGPTGIPTITAITNADDGWREPDSGLLDELRSNDMRDPRVLAAVIKRHTDREEAVERDKLREREARQGDALDTFKKVTNASVSMSDVPWHQNAAGRRGVKK